jgi:parallel beta-helix repeat protein
MSGVQSRGRLGSSIRFAWPDRHPQPGTDYIYTTTYYAKGSTWLPVMLTGNNAAPSYSTGVAQGSLAPAILLTLTPGTNYVVLWDWLWDATAGCYKGPGLNQCNTGTWRIQAFTLTSTTPTPTPSPSGCTSGCNNYYVSASGSDTNFGSQTSPWKTINHADSALQLGSGGTIVHVLPGTYAGPITTSKSGTASARIVFISDTKYGAKIVTANWIPAGAYVDIDGFDMTSPGYGYCVAIPNGATNHDIHVIGNYCHDVSLQANNCPPVGGMNDTGANHDDWFIGNIVRHVGNSNGGTPGACASMHGLYLNGQRDLIENNVVSGAAGWGIQVRASLGRQVIANNTFFNNNGGMVFGECLSDAGCDTPCSPLCGPMDYMTVINNIVVNNQPQFSIGGSEKFGINYYHVTGTHWQVSNNLIYGNLPSDYAHHGGTCIGGTPISGTDANGTAGGCPSTNPKSDSSTAVTFTNFQTDWNPSPASNYSADNYQIKAGSNPINNGTTQCASSPGLNPCTPTTDFSGKRKAAQMGGLSFGWGWLSGLVLHLDGEGFGEFEAEGGLGGQDNLLLPCVGGSRGSRTCT